MPASVHLYIDDDVAVISLDRAPGNAIRARMRRQLWGHIETARAHPSVRALVLVGRGPCFSAGLDLRELGRSAELKPELGDIANGLEAMAMPTIAVMHGVALGGGLELAFGCHYRLAIKGLRVGFPDIRLGLIPGAGGIQRLLRVVGLETSLDILLSGQQISTADAAQLGIVDSVADGDPTEAGLAYARELLSGEATVRRIREFKVPIEQVDEHEFILDKMKQLIQRRARGLLAPWHIIESLENAFALSFDDALAKERKLFYECLGSAQSRAQRHLYLAERKLSRRTKTTNEVTSSKTRPVAVVGGHASGIALCMGLANNGTPVRFVELSEPALESGIALLRRRYQRQVDKGFLTPRGMDKRLGLIRPSVDYSNLSDVDLAFACLTDDSESQLAAARELDAACSSDAILVSASPLLDVNQFAAATSRPSQVLGVFLRDPRHRSRILELIRGDSTSHGAMSTVRSFMTGLGKIGVQVAFGGFSIGERMLRAAMQQAYLMIEEGATPAHIDQAIFDFGFPRGPMRVEDSVGIHMSRRMAERYSGLTASVSREPQVLDFLCAHGHLGVKQGVGWFRYETDSPVPRPDDDTANIIEMVVNNTKVEQRKIESKEIVERWVYTLINEGARILDEGLIRHPEDIDLLWAHAYNFPMHYGGPMYYADVEGIAIIHHRLIQMRKDGLPVPEPCTRIDKLMRKGLGFYDS